MCGIAAARFYLEVHPECQLVILEQDSCPGGVWNSRKQPGQENIHLWQSHSDIEHRHRKVIRRILDTMDCGHGGMV